LLTAVRAERPAPPDAADRSLRVVTWNVARRNSLIVEQATALATREPDAEPRAR
jgi:hypothetical protein